MPPGSVDRRAFLRVASLAALGVAAGCTSNEPEARPTPTGTTTTPASPTVTTPTRPVAWRSLSARGPQARSHHTLTANEDGTIVFLFGGKAKGRVLDDAWAFERSTRLWQPLPEKPPGRFGHSAGFVDGHLVIFGGQAGSRFFNDAWAFDPSRGVWTKLSPSGRPPPARYGASGTTIANSLAISHGFRNTGRFDDTWALSTRWTNVSPPPGAPRPFKRCLHRAEYLSGSRKMVLFGGQTDGRPFLGDTWIYDPTALTWAEKKGAGPSPRNLYAAAATATTMYLFGGLSGGGALNDLWSFDGTRWSQLTPSGTAPRRRGGVEGALTRGPNMIVFGGTDGSREFADLWELSLPV